MSEEKKPGEGNNPQLVASRKGAAIKALFLVAFVIVAIYIIRFTSAREFFTEKALNQFLDRAGLWAPLVFMLVYTAGICLFVPGTLLTALGAALFGPYRGFVYVWIGAWPGRPWLFGLGGRWGGTLPLPWSAKN